MERCSYMSNRLPYALVAAVAGALACTSPVSAAMRIGQTKTFNLNDMDEIGTMNAILDAKLGSDVMATGGTIKRVSSARFLYCGYYLERPDGG